MLAVAIAAIVALALVALALAHALRAQIRQAARREDLLVNQVCALAGKPWLEPPSYDRPAPPEPEMDRFVYPGDMGDDLPL